MPEYVLEKIRGIPEKYAADFSDCVDDFIRRINASESQKKNSYLPQEESLKLFEYFTGSLHVDEDFDAKKEYLSYLDEKYGA